MRMELNYWRVSMRLTIIALAMMLLPVDNSLAQDAKVLTLDDAVQTALQNNYTLQATRRSASAASWGVKRAYTEFLPSVNFSLVYTRLDNATLDRANAFYNFVNDPENQAFLPEELRRNVRPGAWKNSFGPSISVTQPIFAGGALVANLNQWQANDLRAQADLQNTEQQTVLNVQHAYFGVLKATDLLAVARDYLQTTEEHLHSARRKVEAGLRSRSEILRWEVQKATAESQLILAENRLTIAKTALNQVLGVDLNTEYSLNPVDDVPVNVPSTLAEQTELALQKHPGLRVAEAIVDVANAQTQLARSNFVPKVNLAYNYSWEANDTFAFDSYKQWSLGIVATFPIFNSFRDYAGYQQTRQTKQQMENLREDYKRALSLQVKHASLSLDAAKKRVTITEKAKAEAEENFRIIKNSYDVGLASNLDYLDAQNANNQARWNFIDARYDFLLAKSELARAMGVLER
jgi:TolC family type I secretion outer membrane protein